MTKRITTALLAVLFLALLAAFALAVPNGKLSDDVISRYRNEQMEEDEDSSWLLNY